MLVCRRGWRSVYWLVTDCPHIQLRSATHAKIRALPRKINSAHLRLVIVSLIFRSSEPLLFIALMAGNDVQMYEVTVPSKPTFQTAVAVDKTSHCLYLISYSQLCLFLITLAVEHPHILMRPLEKNPTSHPYLKLVLLIKFFAL